MKYILTALIAVIAAVSIFPATIYDIQYTTNVNGSSPMAGDTVEVSGIVTRVLGPAIYIQDAPEAWHGLLVYDFTADVQPGDSITVNGVVTEYYDKTEISPVLSLTVNSAGHELPGPVLVATSDMAKEQWEGMFVQFENVVVTSAQNSYNEWQINDGSGPCTVDEDTDAPYSYTPAVNDTLKFVRGIVDYDFGAFKLFPVGDGDILKTLSGSGYARVNPKYAAEEERINFRLDVWPSVDTVYGKLDYIYIELPAIIEADSIEMGIDTLLYVIEPDTIDSVTSVTITGIGLYDTLNIYVAGFVHSVSDTMTILTGTDASDAARIAKLPVIGVLPEDLEILDISEVQRSNDGYNSVYYGTGEVVTVKGVVTGPSAIFSPTATSTGFWMQDNTAGINVYSGADANNTSFTLGTEVIISGTIEEYAGVTELKYSDPATDVIVINDTIAEVAPYKLENSMGVNELFEGELLKAEFAKVVTSPVDAGTGRNFQVMNGLTVIDVRVTEKSDFYDDPDLYTITPGKLVNVTGIGGQYDTEAPYTGGYQLMVRFKSDVEVIDNEQDSTYSFQVFPNPVSFDAGQVCRIEIGALDDEHITVRIFDLAGRMIKLLAENVPGSSTFIWDGTDELGRKANIGAYIIVADKVDANGKVERKSKPVVVSTKID